MLWFAIQLVPLLVGALAAGVLVGWLIWARSLRTARAAHRSDVGVLRTQVASLGDESRRLQQRFGGLAADLDGSRLEVQRQLQELANTREAFRMSQANLATAESEISQTANVRSESQSEIDRLDQKSAALHVDLLGVSDRLDASQAEVVRLSGVLESTTADASHARLEIEAVRTALQTSERLLSDNQRELVATQDDLALSRRDLDEVRRELDQLARASEASRGELLSSQTQIRADADIAIATLRRLWTKSEAERFQSDQRRVATERSMLLLRGEQVALRRQAASSLTFLDASKQQALADVASLRHEQELTNLNSTKREMALRLESESRAQSQAESHRVAIDHWRRDLHQRFDELEVQKTNVHLRDEKIGQLERQVLHVKEEVRAETRAEMRADSDRLAAERSDALNERDKAVEALNEALAAVETARIAAGHAQDGFVQHEAVIEGLTQQVEFLDGRLLATQGDLERVSFERHVLEEERDRLMDSLAVSQDDHSVQRAALHKMIASLEHDNDGLGEERVVLRRAVSDLHEERKTLTTQLDEVSSQNDLLVIDNVAVEQSRVELLLVHDQISQQLETTVEERDAALRAYDSSHAQRVDLESSLAASLRVQQQQNDEVRQLNDQLATTERIVQEKDGFLVAAQEREASGQAIVAKALRRDELLESEHVRKERVLTERLQATETELVTVRLEANSWRREITQLRQLYAVTQAQRASSSIDLSQLSGGSSTSLSVAPRRIRSGKSNPETDVAQTTTLSPKTTHVTFAHQGDNLQRIEGIGPKIEAALKAAGISSYVRLEAASPSQLRDALASAGLTFAPSLVGWSKQAAYLVAGDEEGFLRFTEILVAGRDERNTQG